MCTVLASFACVEWYRGSARSVGKHLPSSLDVWKIHILYGIRLFPVWRGLQWNVLFIFLFFFRVEASSGITVTAARFSPVHLFILFFPKVGRRCVLLCFWLLDEAFHRQVNDKFGAVQKIWLPIVEILERPTGEMNGWTGEVQPFISLIEQSNLDDSMGLFTRWPTRSSAKTVALRHSFIAIWLLAAGETNHDDSSLQVPYSL